MSFVKLCGMTRAVDVRAACALDIDAIGFVLTDSKRRADPAFVADAVAEVPSSIATVAVFRDQPLDDVLDLVATTGVDSVQLHGSESADFVASVREVADLLIVAMDVDDPRLASIDDFSCDALLLDASVPGSGATFDWSRVGDLPSRRRVILAGGLDPENVSAAIEAVRPWGVDVASGVESTAGVKDHDAMRAFVRAARAALTEFSTDPRPA